MSILTNLRREWKTYLSQRLWILAVLLLVLCALGLVQYHWIDQVAQAERQQAKTNLTTALSDLASDFDIEITRIFAVFQFPAVNPADYSERYKEWLRRAPYPGLIRGVYILETRKVGSFLRGVIPGEPSIRSTEWQRDLPALASPLGVATVTAPTGSAAGFQLSSRGGVVRFTGSSNPEVVVDGNPAFVFPVMPTMPDVATQGVKQIRRLGSSFGSLEIGGIGGPLSTSQWAVVVLDASYIKTIFLPSLLKVHFPNGSASDYDVLVVNKGSSTPSRIVFHSESAPPEGQFGHYDGSISLFALRMDCFLASPSTNDIAVVGTRILQSGRQSNPSSGNSTDLRIAGPSPQVHVLTGIDRLAGILAPTSPSCGNSALPSRVNSEGSWEMLVRYRAGSLDETMTTFRQRSLLLSSSVLLVLALGICMLVVLTERARALAEMQTEFVLGVSHELRTPLTVIRVAADNLKKGMVENSEQAQKYGEIINAHASELSNMIEETLEFARMQSIPRLRDGAPVSPEQIVKSSLASCERALHDAGIQVELHLAPALPLVDVDVRLVNSCLENLIQNVVKYATAGRWMAIRAKKVDRPEGERVQISVEDRGPGISPIDLPHIFEPFYRGTRREVSQVHGVGLGLTLVKRVVEVHDGTIEVVSSDITGTSFFLFFPLHRAQPDAQKAV